MKETALIKNEIRRRVGSGEPKQSILDDISKKYKKNMAIIKMLESTPSIAMKKKYYYHNIGVFILLFAIFVLDSIISAKFFFPEWLNAPKLIYNDFEKYIIMTVNLINIALDVMLLIGADLYRMETYSWIAVRALISLVQIITVNVASRLNTDSLIYFTLVLLVASFVAGMFMGVKLSPRRVPKTIEVEIENEKIKKTIYVFPD